MRIKEGIGGTCRSRRRGEDGQLQARADTRKSNCRSGRSHRLATMHLGETHSVGPLEAIPARPTAIPPTLRTRSDLPAGSWNPDRHRPPPGTAFSDPHPDSNLESGNRVARASTFRRSTRRMLASGSAARIRSNPESRKRAHVVQSEISGRQRLARPSLRLADSRHRIIAGRDSRAIGAIANPSGKTPNRTMRRPAGDSGRIAPVVQEEFDARAIRAFGSRPRALPAGAVPAPRIVTATDLVEAQGSPPPRADEGDTWLCRGPRSAGRSSGMRISRGGGRCTLSIGIPRYRPPGASAARCGRPPDSPVGHDTGRLTVVPSAPPIATSLGGRRGPMHRSPIRWTAPDSTRSVDPRPVPRANTSASCHAGCPLLLTPPVRAAPPRRDSLRPRSGKCAFALVNRRVGPLESRCRRFAGTHFSANRRADIERRRSRRPRDITRERF